MKNYIIKFSVLVSAILLSNCNSKKEKASDSDFLPVEDQYFGEKPPGLTPKDLDPTTFFSEDWELGDKFTPDLDEFYFTTSGGAPFNPSVVVFRKENRVWKQYKFHTTDNDTLYSKDKYIVRIETGWSAIKSLGASFDSIPIMRLTASSKGTLVFDEGKRDGYGVIRYSKIVNGKREAPQPLSKEINTGRWNAHPYIAPDESYIIWDSEREGGYGDNDMYISFRQPDGSWGTAINFGDEINTDGEDSGGYVTPDGRYLSYCPRCDPPYDRKWVDAKIIETLKNKQ